MCGPVCVLNFHFAVQAGVSKLLRNILNSFPVFLLLLREMAQQKLLLLYLLVDLQQVYAIVM
jgi:hypothetical protein